MTKAMLQGILIDNKLVDITTYDKLLYSIEGLEYKLDRKIESSNKEKYSTVNIFDNHLAKYKRVRISNIELWYNMGEISSKGYILSLLIILKDTKPTYKIEILDNKGTTYSTEKLFELAKKDSYYFIMAKICQIDELREGHVNSPFINFGEGIISEFEDLNNECVPVEHYISFSHDIDLYRANIAKNELDKIIIAKNGKRKKFEKELRFRDLDTALEDMKSLGYTEIKDEFVDNCGINAELVIDTLSITYIHGYPAYITIHLYKNSHYDIYFIDNNGDKVEMNAKTRIIHMLYSTTPDVISADVEGLYKGIIAQYKSYNGHTELSLRVMKLLEEED